VTLSTISLPRAWNQHVRARYYRRVVRRRILGTAPVRGATDSTCEVHCLTSARDWLDLVWALKSFYVLGGLRFRLCIHDDGTLSPDAIAALRSQFPDSRIIARRAAHVVVSERLRGYPGCRVLRELNVLALKAFDFPVFLESDRMLVIDSDILCFRSPDVLLNRILDSSYENTTFNKDWGDGYSVDSATASGLVGFTLHPFVNSGLGLAHRDTYQFTCFEEWLHLPGILSHTHRIEQTLVGLACSRAGHEFLPSEYDVSLDPPGDNPVVKHYTGPIRSLLYSDGFSRVAGALGL
jgi:hypothetical protein